MALIISPKSYINMVIGEEYAFTLDVSAELRSKTISSFTYKIYDDSDVDVTSTIGGGSSIASNVIMFGIIASTIGSYTLQFVVTCNDLLPDGITPYEFIADMSLTVE